MLCAVVVDVVVAVAVMWMGSSAGAETAMKVADLRMGSAAGVASAGAGLSLVSSKNGVVVLVIVVGLAGLPFVVSTVDVVGVVEPRLVSAR